MTAREVVDLIKKNLGVPWNERSYGDTFKLGNPDSTVKGIATTVMVTFHMLKRANAAGLNMVITHEDTLWNDRDDTKDLAGNPLYKLKTEYVLKKDMIIWRIHDHMHAMRFHGRGIASFGRRQGRRECDDAPEYLHDPGDNAGGVRDPGEAADRLARISLRRQSERKGEQDPLRPRIRDAAHNG